MDKSVDNYWELKLACVKEALEANNFKVHMAGSAEEAGKLLLDEIIPETGASSISWGMSMTFVKTGAYNALKDSKDLTVIDTYDKSLSPEEKTERRRQALLTDMFITGTNAVTEDGFLVNLDMIGNRVAALTFGPKNVVVLVGRNKIVDDLNDAMVRVKRYAAPVNVMRLEMKTPCSKTGVCSDCSSSARICNTWTITEKSFPAGRVHVVLVNEDLGF